MSCSFHICPGRSLQHLNLLPRSWVRPTRSPWYWSYWLLLSCKTELSSNGRTEYSDAFKSVALSPNLINVSDSSAQVIGLSIFSETHLIVNRPDAPIDRPRSWPRYYINLAVLAADRRKLYTNGNDFCELCFHEELIDSSFFPVFLLNHLVIGCGFDV